MYQDNETATMLVYQDNPVGIELFSYVKNFLLFQWIRIDGGNVSENALYLSNVPTFRRPHDVIIKGLEINKSEFEKS